MKGRALDDQAESAHAQQFDIAAACKALETGAPLGIRNVGVYSSVINGRRFSFASDRRMDPIQRKHRNGAFYEEEELEDIKGLFPSNGVFVDIGTNIGNHSLFVAGFLSPSRIIPFEPNPVACRLLLANIALNNLVDVFDLSNLGKGVSDTPSNDFAMEDRDRNLGAAKMLEGEGDIEVVVGDDALEGVTPDFIKIDVEGMEIRVLNGLRKTIKRARPTLFVEVDQPNDDAFHTFVDEIGYRVIKKMGQYKSNKNYILKPAD